MQPGWRGSRPDPSGDGPVRGGRRRSRRGRAVPVQPGRRAASEGLRAAGRRARVGTRPRSDHPGPSPAAVWRPPAGGRAPGRLPTPIADSTTSSGSTRTVLLPTWQSARTGAFSPPLSASSAQEGGAAWTPSTRARRTASELSRTACQSEQSSTLVATGRSHASQAVLGPSAPSRPQQAPPRFSGISRVPRKSPGAMTIASGALSDWEWQAHGPGRRQGAPGRRPGELRTRRAEAAYSSPSACHATDVRYLERQ